MKTIVLSGINLYSGGPLSVFTDCLDSIIEQKLDEKYRIIAFIHKKELFIKYEKNIELVELPLSRKSYVFRLYYEYIYFWKYSLKNNIDIWLSLHDITPRVKAKKLYTYCHNPSPFMKRDIRKIKYSIKNVLMSYFYKYLYRINIKAADGVIVQQEWIRREFLKMYPIKNVIVARPRKQMNSEKDIWIQEDDKYKEEMMMTKFIYPSVPRFFKNFEVICEASKYLNNSGVHDFEVWLTLDGSENSYASDLVARYEKCKSIKWIGYQAREKLFELYRESDCMIFPSSLETWGLPISEYKETKKDIILVNLPYAYETLGTYDKVMFFNVDDSSELAEKMLSVINRKPCYQPQEETKIDEPYAEDWEQLLVILCSNI